MKIKNQRNKVFAKGTREFTGSTELLYLFLKCTYSGNKDLHRPHIKEVSLPAFLHNSMATSRKFQGKQKSTVYI